jgi:hypothetical protein
MQQFDLRIPTIRDKSILSKNEVVFGVDLTDPWKV